jgi:BirA family biotin operon repressor/biotin-[acetyl-CoA-carboxylase] ligase
VSFVLHPYFLRVDQQFSLIKTISLAVKDTLDAYLIDKAKIKWPNDIYVNDAKIAGILIELSTKGAYLGNSIVGIGINVNQLTFNSNLNATSLILELGRGVDLDRLLSELSFHVEKRYLALRRNYLIDEEEYLKSLYRLNTECLYNIQGSKIKMTNRGVDSIGQIILEDEFGRKNSYGLHQISMVI